MSIGKRKLYNALVDSIFQQCYNKKSLAKNNNYSAERNQHYATQKTISFTGRTDCHVSMHSSLHCRGG